MCVYVYISMVTSIFPTLRSKERNKNQEVREAVLQKSTAIFHGLSLWLVKIHSERDRQILVKGVAEG